MALLSIMLGSAATAKDCPLPVGAGGQLSLSDMSQALKRCAENAPAPEIWAEIIDLGSYAVAETDPQNQAITKLTHNGWERSLPLQRGLLFGFRAQILAEGEISGETIDIAYYRPGDTSPFDTTRKQLVPNSIASALFLLGRDEFMLPGVWRIELRHNGQVLAAQRFRISPQEE